MFFGVDVEEVLAAMRGYEQRTGRPPTRVVVPGSIRYNGSNFQTGGASQLCGVPIGNCVAEFETPVLCGVRMTSAEAGQVYFDGAQPADKLEERLRAEVVLALTRNLRLPTTVRSDPARDELVATTTLTAARMAVEDGVVLLLHLRAP